MQRQTRTNSRALSLSSEKRGKEVPSEADVVVIGENIKIMLAKNVFKFNFKLYFLLQKTMVGNEKQLHSNVTGGGSLGCQTLYHLAKLGVTNTVLLEKEQLTAGQPVRKCPPTPGHLSPLVVRTLEQP